MKPNKIVRLKNFARGSLFFQERLHKFPTTGRATWMRHTGSGIPTFWTCFHPVDMDMQTLLHEFERRHCYWQKKRNQKRQYEHSLNYSCWLCLLSLCSKKIKLWISCTNARLYPANILHYFRKGKIRDKLPTQTHTTSTVHAAFTCDQFVKQKNTALHFINNC